jgi:hypothetical protein
MMMLKKAPLRAARMMPQKMTVDLLMKLWSYPRYSKARLIHGIYI